MSKNKTKQEKNDSKTINSPLSMHQKFANLFLIGMFTLFPIFMTDKLFNVRKDRLDFFIVTNIILLFFIMSTYICGIDKELWPKKLFKLSSTDISFVIFFIVCIFSTIFSEYGKDAVTGDQGRNCGLILMSAYFFSYFLISRYLKYKSIVFDIFVITGCIVCIIAIMHEFYADPFQIITQIKEDQQETFISTIGNINLYSAFVCVVLPVAASLLVMSDSLLSTILYSVQTAVCFMGLIVSNSDSGYFGLIAFMAVLFVFSCSNAKRLFKFFLTVFVMLLSCKILYLLSLLCHEKMRELDTLPHTLVFDRKVYIAISAVGFIALILYLVSEKMADKPFPKAVQIVTGVLVGLFILSIGAVFFYFSVIDKTTNLGNLTKYLRLNDQWGTHRGYAWIRSIILFKNGGIKNILIGTGPDTFGPVIKAVYREDMLKRHGSVFDNAHNEYLNYLVTVGILGVLAYISILGTIIFRCVKRSKDKLSFLLVITVIVSYSAQALFNLATPIVTPYLFVFISIGEAFIRNFDSQNAQSQ